MTQESGPMVQTLQGIVEAEREAVRHIPRGRSVEPLGTQPGRVSSPVILGAGAGIGSIDKPSRKVPFHIKVHAFVVRIAVVVGIGNGAEAAIKPGGNLALVSNQIPSHGVDIDSVADKSRSIAV